VRRKSQRVYFECSVGGRTARLNATAWGRLFVCFLMCVRVNFAVTSELDISEVRGFGRVAARPNRSFDLTCRCVVHTQSHVLATHSRCTLPTSPFTTRTTTWSGREEASDGVGGFVATVSSFERCAPASVTVTPPHPNVVKQSDDANDAGVAVTLVLWTRVNQTGTPCTPAEPQNCVRLLRRLTLTKDRSETELIARFVPDASADHYIIVVEVWLPAS
jgi:hypothetical protein